MKLHRLHRDDENYPQSLLARLGEAAPDTLFWMGEVTLLKQPKTAILCSRACPGDLILKTYDFALALCERREVVIGGFHSPVEKECLRIFLRDRLPVIICLARSLEGLRLPVDWRPALKEGRLLLLSAFPASQRRVCEATAVRRNEIVAALADEVLIAYAEPGGRMEELCREVIAWGKPVCTFEDQHNGNLLEMGAGTWTKAVATQFRDE